MPQIDKDYIATGKVRYVFRDFPLESIHARAAKAAEAAHCAGNQGKYWEMHDKLFANQKALTPKNLAEYARAIGLASRPNPSKNALTAASAPTRSRAASPLEISGTPALLLGISEGDQVKKVKLMMGALPFSLYKEEIDKLLAEKPEK